MTAKTTLKALFFDLDGVLVDVSQSHRHAIEETVEHFTGSPVLAGTVQRYQTLGTFVDDCRVTHAIITDTGMTVSFGRVVEEFRRRYRGDSWNGFICEEAPLVATRTLERLGADGRILGIVTSRPNAEARWALEHFGWKRYFPLVLPREKQDDRPASDPYALQHALLILDAVGRHVAPGEVLYVGDVPEALAAARTAGLWTVGLVCPAADPAGRLARQLQAQGALAVLGHPDDLVELVDHFDPFAALAQPAEA